MARGTGNTRAVKVWLPDRILERLKTECEETGITRSEWTRKLVMETVDGIRY